ncbi:hypothetical protein LCGC14_0667360 [marine sediment metagenome]|uniref:Methyltransferase domain-containing protein n=1 Tax=marine sediment metagenome TaxID=412755 RepID=A0A0F9TDC8_9ZZZZ
MGKYISVPDKLIELSKRTKGKNYREGIRQGLFFMSLILVEQPKIAVEIGSQTGFSTCCMAMAMADNDYADKAGYVYGIEKTIPHTKTANRHLKEFGLSEYANVTQGDSKEVIHSTRELNSIGFMFIDGDHSYKKVYSDIFDNFQFIKNNALVVFHDYNADTKKGIDTALSDLENRGHEFEKIKINILTNGLLIRKIK